MADFMFEDCNNVTMVGCEGDGETIFDGGEGHNITQNKLRTIINSSKNSKIRKNLSSVIVNFGPNTPIEDNHILPAEKLFSEGKISKKELETIKKKLFKKKHY
jgi:hypothetical protein